MKISVPSLYFFLKNEDALTRTPMALAQMPAHGDSLHCGNGDYNLFHQLSDQRGVLEDSVPRLFHSFRGEIFSSRSTSPVFRRTGPSQQGAVGISNLSKIGPQPRNPVTYRLRYDTISSRLLREGRSLVRIHLHATPEKSKRVAGRILTESPAFWVSPWDRRRGEKGLTK